MDVRPPSTVGARLLGPGARTALLTAAVAAAGLLALTALPQDPVLPPPPLPQGVLLAALLAAMLATEMRQVHVEVRRQAHSFSLTSAPLLVGLLYCPPDHLVAARLATAAVAFAVQRMRPTKVAFNLAGYLLDACLLVLVTDLLSGPRPQVDLWLAVTVHLAATASEVVAACLVLLVIRINSGPLGSRDLVEAVVTSAAFTTVCTVAAVTGALLLEQGPVGWLLLVLLSASAFASYRVQVALRRRHASLELVKGFVELGAQTTADSGDSGALGAVLLARLREVVRSERAKLLLPADDGDGWVVHASAHEDGTAPMLIRTGRRSQDGLLAEVAADGGPRLLRRDTPDRHEAAFLSAHGLREAMVCPVDLGDHRGLVLVADRLGETSRLGRHDLALLQTLAGHLAVALRSARLLERQRHDARHDALTGLPNLVGLSELAAPLLAAGSPPAVLVLTLDRAAEVNAVLGHSSGDELLVLVARRLELALPGALVGRLSGEEFAVVLAPREGAPVLDDAVAAAARVEQALDAPVQLSSASVSTTASVGIAVAAAGDDLEAVVRRADTARTSSTATSTGPVVYTASMDEGRAERVGLLADLRLALDTDQLSLHYQPKLDLAFGLVTGVEALVRWDHPRLGRLSPDRFVPLAESTGLVEPFTHHLLSVALRQLRRWQDGGVDVSVAVNLSARNVANPALPDLVAAALTEAGVPATRLTLELTESTVMSDHARAVPVLERLAAIGVTLSLDDFGTGYSSLSYLQRLPVQELKIDRSFVRGLETTASAQDSAVAAALIRSITALKETLGLRIVAEGVEDAHVLERVRDLGCDLVQGYHVARPAPADQLDPATTRLRTTHDPARG